MGGIYLGIQDMVHTIHSMLYTICYAGHTTVYIIGIYHGILSILNDIYLYVYTMVYTITSFLHSSPTASLSPAAPPVTRSSCRRFNVWSALASFSQSLSMPLLSFFYSDPARLPPPIAPHPVVELIEPASVAYPHAGICGSFSPDSKALGWDAILVCDPLWSMSIITKQKPTALQQHCVMSFGLQQMNINRVKVGCTYGIYLKVGNTVWGICHANYDLFHAIKVAKEVCMD
jgi:hypothetical protein